MTPATLLNNDGPVSSGMEIWRPTTRCVIKLRERMDGMYRLDGMHGYQSANVVLAQSPSTPAEKGPRLSIDVVVPSPAAEVGLALRGIIAIKVFNSHPDRPLERFAAFERRIMARYYAPAPAGHSEAAGAAVAAL